MRSIFGSTAFRRVLSVLTFVLGLVTLGFNLAQVPLDSLTHQTGTGGPLADTLTVVGTTVPTAVVGTLLAIRRPRNPIGWLLLGILISSGPTNQYLILDYRMHHGTLPLGGLAVVLLETWPLLLVSLALLLWLFPDGTLPAGRLRRPAAIAVVGGLALATAASTSGLVAVAEHRVMIKATGDLVNPPLGFLAGPVVVPVLVSLLAWLVFQVPTYRRAGGERRQQLKWLYSGAAITAIAFIVGVFVEPIAQGKTLGYGTQPVVNVITNLAEAALPICLGVAIFKYRLYELNRIISRVVSYTVITALLAGVFFGLVLLATHVLPFKTTVGVAGSTLVIAALFNPLRRRVQNLVDRRFNRARYDAEAIVAAFNARLRQTVDLDTVQFDLLGVTESAFQPTHVSVWIAPASGIERLSSRACNIFYFVLVCRHDSNLAAVETDGQPSFTAMTAAAARAAHLIVDGEPAIFADTLAEAMLGERAEEFLAYHRAYGTHPVLAGARAQVTCRSRYTEDQLARAVQAGIGQYVILGAGLDTFAYRSSLARQVRVFEIDHPATQEWKRRHLPTRGSVTFVPLDLLGESLGDGLGRAGFDFGAPAFVSWLGVTMYLDQGAVERTAAVLGGLAPGSELVVDYMLPAGLRDADGDSYAEQVGQASAERGEPWVSLFAPDGMAALLGGCGFGAARDVSQREMIPAGLWDRADGLRPVELSRIAHAFVGS